MTVRAHTATDNALVDRLIDLYEFKPYRNYRILSRKRQSAVVRAEIDRLLGSAGSFGVVASTDPATAIAFGRPLPWDSEFFGVKMGRIDYLLRSEGADRATLGAALAGALDRFRAIGVPHVTIKVDVGDTDSVYIAEDQGFRLMDAIVTYISHPKRPPPRRLKAVGLVRPFVPADTPQVLEVTCAAYQGFRGRFQVDPHLPRERSDQFYLEWARKCCSGAMADRIYVAEDGHGRLVGWASVKRAEPVSTVGGAIISSGSLGACRPDRPGAYAALIAEAAIDNHAAGVLTEAMTQHSNFPMVRVLEAVGAQYARAEYTLHGWLG